MGDKYCLKTVEMMVIFPTTGMWSSREMMKDDSDKQLYVKTTLRELIIYFIFLVTVLISE